VQQWNGSKIEREVEFTTNSIPSGSFFGARELFYGLTYGVTVESREPNTAVLFFSKNDLSKILTAQEVDRILSNPMVLFPSEEEIQ